MKKHMIAVGAGLSNIRNMLVEEGYQVVDIDDNIRNVDAVVLTGMDDDLMGIEAMATDGFVVDATGRHPEEILQDLEDHFRIMDE